MKPENTTKVRPRKGGDKWIEIDRAVAEHPYYDLLSEPEPEENKQ